MATSTEEQYLKVIHGLAELDGDGLVRMGDISQAMSLTAGTITSMLKQLAAQGLLAYLPRLGCRLSESGRLVALRLVRKHRLIETFLVKTLAYDWAQVHAEAETLEHVVSDRFIESIDRLLEYPTFDPHGSPIPGQDLILLADQAQPLSACLVGQTICIARVSDGDSAVLSWLKTAGIVPGQRFRIVEVSRFAQVITIVADDQSPIAVGVDLASRIFVKDDVS